MAATDEPSRKNIKTRSLKDYFLIGQSADHINGNKLLLLGKILHYVLHLKELSPVTAPLKNHLSYAVDKVLLICSRAGIETVTKQNAIMQLKKEYDNWQQLCKNKTRLTDPGRKREIFAEALSKLWDIGALDTIQIIQKIECCQNKGKLKIYFFMKTSRAQEKVSLEGKMHCIRKVFKYAKKDLPDQLLSPSRAVMMKQM